MRGLSYTVSQRTDIRLIKVCSWGYFTLSKAVIRNIHTRLSIFNLQILQHLVFRLIDTIFQSHPKPPENTCVMCRTITIMNILQCGHGTANMVTVPCRATELGYKCTGATSIVEEMEIGAACGRCQPDGRFVGRPLGNARHMGR
jgi:hypothetical protein